MTQGVKHEEELAKMGVVVPLRHKQMLEKLAKKNNMNLSQIIRTMIERELGQWAIIDYDKQMREVVDGLIEKGKEDKITVPGTS